MSNERQEQIRQVQEEKYLLLGMITLLASEPGDLTAPIYKRTVARLESALADLQMEKEPDWCTMCDRPKNDCACVENGGNY